MIKKDLEAVGPILEKALNEWLEAVPTDRKIFLNESAKPATGRAKTEPESMLRREFNPATGRTTKGETSYKFKRTAPPEGEDIVTEDEEIEERYKGYFKIKRNDIRVFNPHYNNPDDLGTVMDGKNIIFTDVFSFIDRIKTYTDDPTRPDVNNQIKDILPTLLGGPAAI
ncbi:hypothetical protein GE21DRAFT_1337079 [Neurospora crassa]|nr:hypothetical protein GE21DRAFT_1337079 [Neurospora crassa]